MNQHGILSSLLATRHRTGLRIGPQAHCRSDPYTSPGSPYIPCFHVTHKGTAVIHTDKYLNTAASWHITCNGIKTPPTLGNLRFLTALQEHFSILPAAKRHLRNSHAETLFRCGGVASPRRRDVCLVGGFMVSLTMWSCSLKSPAL